MRKVSFFMATLNKGGLERVSSLIVNHLSKDYLVTIYIFTNDKIEYEINPNIKIASLVKYRNNKIRLMKKIRYILKNETDIGISMGSNLSLMVLIANLFIKKPIIISERSNPKHDNRGFLINSLQNHFFKKSEKIVFQTNDVKKMFSKKVQLKSIIIENPVVTNLPKASLKNNKIVSIGRLTNQKNHELLLRAFKTVNEQFPNYILEIYGTGYKEVKLINLINELDLSNNAFLKGNSDNIHEEIKDAKLFVIPSKFEGLSNALLEAYTMGIPCIGSDVVGINNVIRDNVTGLLFKSDDLNDLSAKMIFSLNNYEMMKVFRENAINDASRFQFEYIMDKWNKIVGDGIHRTK